MSVEHKYDVRGMSQGDIEKLDLLISESLSLYFRLKDTGVDDPEQVLIRGTRIEE